jgi:hypothetical protein
MMGSINPQSSDWTIEEREMVCTALTKMGMSFTTIGKVTPDVFDKMCEHLITNPIEFAIVTQSEKGWTIYMSPRPPEDPYFAGRLHMAGSVVLPGRNSKTVLPALVKREVGLDLDKLKHKPEFIGKPIEFM